MRYVLGQQRFGIDLGTSNTVIYQEGKGIVLREPSVIAVRKSTGRVEAVGEEARAMIGRTSQQLEVIYPLRDGVVANFSMVSAMLQLFFRHIQVGTGMRLRRSKVAISVPCGITDVTKRAVEQIHVPKASQKAMLVEEPIAAALGAGISIDEPVGRMVINVGGGTSQMAILSLGGIVASRTVAKGGRSIDQKIEDYLKGKYNLAIGQRTAEDIKMNSGSAMPEAGAKSFIVKGRDLVKGLPATISLNEQEICSLLDDFVHVLVEAIKQVIEECPPELAGDIMDQGIVLCGGGSLLRGLDVRLRTEIGIPVQISEHPMDCVARGMGKLLSYESI